MKGPCQQTATPDADDTHAHREHAARRWVSPARDTHWPLQEVRPDELTCHVLLQRLRVSLERHLDLLKHRDAGT